MTAMLAVFASLCSALVIGAQAAAPTYIITPSSPAAFDSSAIQSQKWCVGYVKYNIQNLDTVKAINPNIPGPITVSLPPSIQWSNPAQWGLQTTAKEGDSGKALIYNVGTYVAPGGTTNGAFALTLRCLADTTTMPVSYSGCKCADLALVKVSACGTDNLVVNGGFEQGLSSWTKISYYNFYTNDYFLDPTTTVVAPSSHAHTGTGALDILEIGPDYYAGLTQNIVLTAGTTYQGSVYVYVAADFALWTLTVGGITVASGGAETSPANSWNLFQFTLTPTVSGNVAVVLGGVSFDKPITIDDLSITPVC